jgi:hypothetical protein
VKATFSKTAKVKFNSNHRKEKSPVEFESYIVIDKNAETWTDGTIAEPIVLRLYHTTGRAYACLWINCGDIHTSGSGYAGGYGYHRGSAAAQEAINNAGIVLDSAIVGRGDSATREAMMALAAACGIKNPAMIRAHA